MMDSTTFSRLLPLIVLLFIVAVVAVIAYVAYVVATLTAAATSKHMRERHITLTREGIRVQYRYVDDEEYRDRTQSLLMAIWNNSSISMAEKAALTAQAATGKRTHVRG